MGFLTPPAGTAGLAGPQWSHLPIAARIYATLVILAGAAAVGTSIPPSFPEPGLFLVLLAFACLTSSWKVNLPIPVANGSTLSVSYAANLMALLLLGPQQAVLVALAGVWTQCTYRPKRPYPLYRTLFSCAAVVLTMVATGFVYVSLGGPFSPLSTTALARPLVGAIATYFVANTTLVAGAIALSNNRRVFDTWRGEFMWLAASFMAAGAAGALAAIVVDRGEHWKALLLAAPIYLTYRTYDLFVGRLEDQKRYMSEMRGLHERTVFALDQAREAERALALEKERLTTTLEEMKQLERARKELLQREHVARASAEEANRLKDQFLATVSHELRTPLSSILGWADMLRRGLLDEPSRDRALAAIYTGAKRQAQLIDDLLDVSRIAAGQLRLQSSVVSLEAAVREAVQMVQPAADSSGIRLRVDVEAGVPPVRGDASRLQQIAWNLLSNALKFTPRGGTVHVSLRAAGLESAELVVTDTGEGIPAAFLPAVFDPFRQADGTSTRAHRGLGIGLSIVKNLVEAHGGTVTAESAGEGMGATFSVQLPAAPSADAAAYASNAALADPMASVSLNGLTALVVDDDEESREVVRAYLQAYNARVLTANSAAQALDVLGRQHADVLLADIGMPGEDGYSLIRQVRSQKASTARIPAAALTAFARAEDRDRALREGFHVHLAKPVDAQALIMAVATLVKRHGPGAGLRLISH
jgi:signal transduction histidine kinase/ActR/RegA family two-component response regulator